MATIHKRRLRSGEVVWELTHGTGTDRQRFVVGRTREEAQEVLNQFNRQLALHGTAPADDTLEATLRQYLAYLSTHRRAGTIRRYARVLKTFHECFLQQCHQHVRSLRQIKPAHLEDYKSRRIDGGISEAEPQDVRDRDTRLRNEAASAVHIANRQANAKFGWLGRKKLHRVVTPKTVNYELRVLQTYFRWAVRRNYLFIDPATNVERFRIPRRTLPKFLTTEDLKAFFAACSPRERRLFMAILLTGMRKGEVEHLTWPDVNFELGVVFIREKPQWNWKPKSDERVIPVSPALRMVLDDQWANRLSDTLVFPNKEGNRDTHILPKLKKICRKAGINPTTVHALRHSFGAHLRMAGVSLADIADLLGHKDLATTQIYAKVHQEHLRLAVSRLNPLTPGTAENSPSRRLLPEPDSGNEEPND